MTTVAAVARPEAGIAWSLPDRGRVGMYGLIAAEAAGCQIEIARARRACEHFEQAGLQGSSA